MRRVLPTVARFDDGGKGHEPRNVGVSEAERSTKMDTSLEGTSPANTLILAQGYHVGLLTHRMVR